MDTMSVGIYLNGVKNSEIAYNMVVGTGDTTYYNPIGNWNGPGIAISVEATSASQNCEYNKVHHNIVINTYAGIRMYNPNPTYYVDYIYIYNNTFIDNQNTFNISNLNDRLDTHIYVKNNLSYPKHTESGHVSTSGSTIDNWEIDYNNWTIKTHPTGIWAGAHDKTGDPNFVKSTWRGSSFNPSDLSASVFVVKAGSSAIDSGVDLGSDYSDSLGDGSKFYTTDPNPNIDPIVVHKVSQYDNTSWEIGATKSTGDHSSAPQPPKGLKSF